MPIGKRRAAVIGAGLAGLTAAYYLAKRGWRVEVWDSESGPAAKCSRANGGQLSASNAETWHSWANVWKGIKWMTKDNAPLLIRPGLDPERLAWLARFLANVVVGSKAEATKKLIGLALESRKLYQEIVTTEGVECDLSTAGILHFYKEESYYRSALAIGDLYRSSGCEWQPLQRSEVVDIEPALANCKGIIGGIWTPSDLVGDAATFCTGLEAVLRRKYGVDFHWGTAVDEQRFDEIAILNDAVVIAVGSDIGKFADFLEDQCTVYPVKGYSITVDLLGQTKGVPRVSLLDDSAKVVCTPLGQKLRIAGTAELTGYDYSVSPVRIKPLVDWLKSNLPAINPDSYTAWSCLRPMTPDMLPLEPRSRRDGVYYHGGHGHLGWTTAASTAQSLVELIESDKF